MATPSFPDQRRSQWCPTSTGSDNPYKPCCQMTARHLIVTRTYDDTNVTIAPHVRVSKELSNSSADPQLEEGGDATTTAGKLGQRKVGALLGIVQRVSLRASAKETMTTAQLHCPSQVLPKAWTGSRTELRELRQRV